MKNFPFDNPLAKIVCERGKFYVCERKHYWNSETQKSAEERIYIGRIVDGVYYSMADYRRLFKRDGTLRAVERPKNRPYTRKTQPKETAVADASKAAESAAPAAGAPEGVSETKPERRTSRIRLRPGASAQRRCLSRWQSRPDSGRTSARRGERRRVRLPVRLPATGSPLRTMPPTCSSPGRPTPRFLFLTPSTAMKSPSFSNLLRPARAGRSHFSASVWPECPRMRSTPTTRRTLRHRRAKFPAVSTETRRTAAIVDRSA